MSDIDKFIKLLSQTDGRDKIYKFLQGVTKILGDQVDHKDSKKKYNALSKSIGEGRSLMRMVKWVGNYNKLQLYAGKFNVSDPKQVLEILRTVGDFGYILGDNLAYLCKYKVLSLDANSMGKNSKIFQFWGYVCATVLDILALLKNSTKVASDATAKERTTIVLSLVKNVSDVVATLAAVGYIAAFQPSATFVGACSATSGAIATYQNWTK